MTNPVKTHFLKLILVAMAGIAVFSIASFAGNLKTAQGDASVLLQKVRNAKSEEEKNIQLDHLATFKPVTVADVDLLTKTVAHQEDRLGKAASRSLLNIEAGSNDLILRLFNSDSKKVHLLGFQISLKLMAKEVAPKILSLLAAQPRFRIKAMDFGGATTANLEYIQQAAEALAGLADQMAIDEILSRDEIMAIPSYGGPLIAKYGASALPKIIAVARRQDTSRSEGAKTAISVMDDEAAIPLLTPLLQDNDPSIKRAAVNGLISIYKKTGADRNLVEKTLKRELDSKDAALRARAYEGLLELDSGKYLPMALEALKRDGDVRPTVLYALMRLRIQEAVPALKEFIKDDEIANPHWTTDRKMAAQAIYKITGERVPYKGLEEDQRFYKDPYNP